jgi:hypothetical protein
VVIRAFKPLLLISLALAILAFIMPWAAWPAKTDLAIRVSAAIAAGWVATVVYALVRFKKRGLWFLLGTPFVVFWFFVLFMIAWGCAHNLRACP